MIHHFASTEECAKKGKISIIYEWRSSKNSLEFNKNWSWKVCFHPTGEAIVFHFCWWQPEIRRQNPLRLVVYPIIFRVSYIPGGCLRFLSSTVWPRFLGWVARPTQIIATSHDLTSKGSWRREKSLFQANIGWWNNIIWPVINSMLNFGDVEKQNMILFLRPHDAWVLPGTGCRRNTGRNEGPNLSDRMRSFRRPGRTWKLRQNKDVMRAMKKTLVL